MAKYLEFALKGDVPSKKNSKRRIKRGNNIYMVPSLAHENWHSDAMVQVSDIIHRNSLELPIKHCNISMLFFPSSKRHADLTNKAESVMDLLVDCGVLVDDNWFVCPKVSLSFGGVIKEDPSVSVLIEKIK